MFSIFDMPKNLFNFNWITKMERDFQTLSSVPPYINEVGKRLSSVISLYKSKKDAANVSGVSAEQLGRYVKGQSSPPFEVLARLASEKNISLDWLASGGGPMRLDQASDTSKQSEPFVRGPERPSADDFALKLIICYTTSVWLVGKGWKMEMDRFIGLVDSVTNMIRAEEESMTERQIERKTKEILDAFSPKFWRW